MVMRCAAGEEVTRGNKELDPLTHFLTHALGDSKLYVCEYAAVLTTTTTIITARPLITTTTIPATTIKYYHHHYLQYH